jgi:hypothetical protein
MITPIGLVGKTLSQNYTHKEKICSKVSEMSKCIFEFEKR